MVWLQEEPMPSALSLIGLTPVRAATLCLVGAAGFGVQAARMHLWLASLGPICGTGSAGLLHCPACPAAMTLGAVGVLLLATARVKQAR
jgi:hypothetical protein